MPHEALRNLFIAGLSNAHAMEAQAEQLLKRQIERLDDFPDIKMRLQEHLDETYTQQRRIDAILENYGESSSTLKDTAMSLFGNMAAVAHMPAEDEVLKNSFASFAFENYETAAYKSLISIAEALGETGAIGPLRQSCEEEEAMAGWLSSQLDSVTRRFIQKAA
ncbi:ferritin-like metal-binding protein YciE [Rhodoblastus acidophilus]|uniref:ferritin-like domain-containing protein n=1 Tax=Rhodoblastus acidophilus TaxID=1074 RepID=UPI00161ED2D1|nr:ferritin-like domain-containing protein [Rhodoblastus acidophilus]MCW2286121.1 ferritin-like metal-binding protein YciE [Rhodoblastus acidophilus]MCW2335015.1 ferritin-like metal-binding protein YciE [Rhodoblastus acidophilus]